MGLETFGAPACRCGDSGRGDLESARLRREQSGGPCVGARDGRRPAVTSLPGKRGHQHSRPADLPTSGMPCGYRRGPGELLAAKGAATATGSNTGGNDRTTPERAPVHRGTFYRCTCGGAREEEGRAGEAVPGRNAIGSQTDGIRTSTVRKEARTTTETEEAQTGLLQYRGRADRR